jgi:8-oxo-dGTP pyrophosphatase MutT (NUDIX family)
VTGIVPPVRRASTVALLRAGPGGPEVLLTHRPASMSFGPGLHVFPGGAVDPADSDKPLVSRSTFDAAACAAGWAGDLGPAAAIAHAVAAVRELYEEAGVLLATTRSGLQPDAGTVEAAHRSGEPLAGLAERLDLVLRTDRLIALSHWVTPPEGVPRRYDTRFYAAALEDASGLGPGGREVAAHEWLTPANALEARAHGRIDLWPPTSTTLAQLARARGTDDIRRWLGPLPRAGGPVTMAVADGIVRVRASGAGGIPGAIVNAYLVGRRRVVVVDPGDPSEEAIEAILAAAAALGAEVRAVLLTAPVPDRAGGALILAGG